MKWPAMEKPNLAAKTFLDRVAKRALAGERVLVPGFGLFYRKTVKAKWAVIPKTRTRIWCAESFALGFRAGGRLRGHP